MGTSASASPLSAGDVRPCPMERRSRGVGIQHSAQGGQGTMNSISRDPLRAATAAALLASALTLPAAGATKFTPGQSTNAGTAVPQAESPGRPLPRPGSGD